MVLFCAHINMPFPPISAVQKSKVENPCLSQFVSNMEGFEIFFFCGIGANKKCNQCVIHIEPEQIQIGSFIFLVYSQD